MEKSIEVLIACPKSIGSELLIGAFSLNPRFRIVAQATSDSQLIEELNTRNPDVVLLDGEICGSSPGALEVLRLLRREAPDVKVVVLLPERVPEHLIACFRSGARGVLFKGATDFDLLCKCMDWVCSGQLWVSSEDLAWIINALEASTVSPSPLKVVNTLGKSLLTKREQDVVRLLMEGFSNREMAQTLKLSEHTIKNYLFRIFDKLGVSSRTELLLCAMNFMRKEKTDKGVNLMRATG